MTQRRLQGATCVPYCDMRTVLRHAYRTANTTCVYNSYITDKYANSNLNAASWLGLGPKKCSKHYTLVNNIPIVFLLLLCFVNIKNESYKEKRNMHKIWSRKTGKKTHWKILVSLPGIEPGASGVALLCTNHYTNRDISILMYKLRYINIALTIQQQCYFSKKATSKF